jgi:hypothetical protein
VTKNIIDDCMTALRTEDFKCVRKEAGRKGPRREEGEEDCSQNRAFRTCRDLCLGVVKKYYPNEGGVDFKVGGAVGICPPNFQEIVDEIFELLGIPKFVRNKPVRKTNQRKVAHYLGRRNVARIGYDVPLRSKSGVGEVVQSVLIRSSPG